MAAMAVAAIVASSSVQAQQPLRVPAGGDPAMACGQKPDGRAYWLEYAFCDLPTKGPGNAKGVIFWSHGVNGDKPQYQFAAPPIVRRLALAGWEVLKIGRNNLYERGWTSSGVRHVDDLIARAQQARAMGYGKVIAGGQSYGGAISVEANARGSGVFHAVLALSPGHGSDAPTGTSGSTRGAYYTLDKQLLDVLYAQKGGRIVLSLPPDDIYHPNRDGDPIWPKARQALQDAGSPFVLFGEGLPIKGHSAGTTAQFDAWFGACVSDFLDPVRTPVSETRCPPPASLPRFLLPADLKIPVPGTSGAERFLGRWEGTLEEGGRAVREVLIVVDRVENGVSRYVLAFGSGPNRAYSMTNYRIAGVIEGDRLKDSGNRPPLNELVLDPARQSLSLKRTMADGQVFTAVLTRKEP